MQSRERQARCQRDCNPLAKQLDAPIVLSERHSRTVLLGSADRDDDGGFARADFVSQFGPREILEEDRGALLGIRERREVKNSGTAGARDTPPAPAACSSFARSCTELHLSSEATLRQRRTPSSALMVRPQQVVSLNATFRRKLWIRQSGRVDLRIAWTTMFFGYHSEGETVGSWPVRD